MQVYCVAGVGRNRMVCLVKGQKRTGIRCLSDPRNRVAFGNTSPSGNLGLLASHTNSSYAHARSSMLADAYNHGVTPLRVFAIHHPQYAIPTVRDTTFIRPSPHVGVVDDHESASPSRLRGLHGVVVETVRAIQGGRCRHSCDTIRVTEPTAPIADDRGPRGRTEDLAKLAVCMSWNTRFSESEPAFPFV